MQALWDSAGAAKLAEAPASWLGYFPGESFPVTWLPDVPGFGVDVPPRFSVQ